jgi:pimeloyl-ACP methyl ester carboxylesterase
MDLDALLEPLDSRLLPSCSTQSHVPVVGGSLRVLHHRPQNPAGRPVVFLPGFSASVPVWQEAYSMLQGRAEFYVVETLDKGTTPLEGAVPTLTPQALAAQVQRFTATLGDHVLVATSWLATSVLAARAEGGLPAPTTVVCDPVPRLWLPWFIPRWSLPFLPATLFGLLRRPLGAIAMAAVAPHERARFESILQSADPRRWKQVCLDGLDTDLLDGRLTRAEGEIWVVNTADDPVHPAADAGQVARALPAGRLVQLELGSGRERFCGGVALAFARTAAGATPALLADLVSDH